jgi:hypothetical protein
MNFFRSTTRFSALLLLVLTVHILAHSLLLPKHELVSLQEQTVCTASLTTGIDGDGETRLGDFKPPKHSFIDYSIFFVSSNFLPAYNPVVSRLLPHKPFQALQNVYLDISVPPDNLA